LSNASIRLHGSSKRHRIRTRRIVPVGRFQRRRQRAFAGTSAGRSSKTRQSRQLPRGGGGHRRRRHVAAPFQRSDRPLRQSRDSREQRGRLHRQADHELYDRRLRQADRHEFARFFLSDAGGSDPHDRERRWAHRQRHGRGRHSTERQRARDLVGTRERRNQQVKASSATAGFRGQVHPK